MLSLRLPRKPTNENGSLRKSHALRGKEKLWAEADKMSVYYPLAQRGLRQPQYVQTLEHKYLAHLHHLGRNGPIRRWAVVWLQLTSDIFNLGFWVVLHTSKRTKILRTVRSTGCIHLNKAQFAYKYIFYSIELF